MTDSIDSEGSDRRKEAAQDAVDEKQSAGSNRSLERAVQELVNVAKEEFSDRAVTLVQETTERLRGELTSWTDAVGSKRSSRKRHRRTGVAMRHPGSRSRYTRHVAYRRARSRRRTGNRSLMRDASNEKICGVCAGLANYWEMETWVVRCIAVTGLIFMPQIALPAYFIACIVMKKDRSKSKGFDAKSRTVDHSSLAPEFGPILSPRNSLRDVQSDLDQAELRLRRMETHVTSGKYELQRQLNKIAKESGA